jgi:S-adenosylmethionine synthetase
MATKSFLFTSESVTEGHPDKVADRISDSVLDAFLKYDANSLVACETLVTTGLCILAGEVYSQAIGKIDFQDLARSAIKEIGYEYGKTGPGFDSESVAVMNCIHSQSPDIRQGVLRADTDIGAGDQGLMFGFACNESDTLMPLPIYLSHLIVKELAKLRKSKEIPWLRPDGKSQVTIEYKNGVADRVHTIVVSTQHNESVTLEEIKSTITEKILKKVVPSHLWKGDPILHINPTGRFVLGGPTGDTGLTGRKIIVDTYGGYAPHGGGAFSGKDPTKVDRSAAYMARYIAKNIVAAGLATKAQIQLAYAIGVVDPVSVLVEDFGTAKVDVSKLESIVREIFPLKPAEIIKGLDLRRPIYAQTAAYGHFGRTEAEFSWEKTDKVAALKSAFSV